MGASSSRNAEPHNTPRSPPPGRQTSPPAPKSTQQINYPISKEEQETMDQRKKDAETIRILTVQRYTDARAIQQPDVEGAAPKQLFPTLKRGRKFPPLKTPTLQFHQCHTFIF